MSFFHSQKKIAKKPTKNQLIPTQTLREHGCLLCPLNKNSELYTPKMPAFGPDRADVMIIGDRPTRADDKHGLHFSGDVGSLMYDVLPDEWDDEVVLDYLNRCHSTTRDDKQRTVQNECCRGHIETQIAQVKPKVIIAVGVEALRWFGARNVSMTLWRGRRFPVCIRGHSCWVFPVMDLLAVKQDFQLNFRNEEMPGDFYYTLERDVQAALAFARDRKAPKPVVHTDSDFLNGVEWVLGKGKEDFEVLLEWYDWLKEQPDFAVDLETTEVRPYSGGRILTVAVGTGDNTIAFPVSHRAGWRRYAPEYEAKVIDLLHKMLKLPGGKVYHNSMFDLEWEAVKVGSDILFAPDVQQHCTMIQAYILDSRKGMLDLDVLCFLNWGFWLKDLSNVDRKNMEAEDYLTTLKYNAMDTKYTHKLHQLQSARLQEQGLQNLYRRKADTAPALVKAQMRGILPDLDAMNRLEEEYEKELKAIEAEFNAAPEALEYRRKQGHLVQLSSPDDVGKFLFTCFGQEQVRKSSGKYSTDESVLTAMQDDVYLVPLILKHRSTTRLQSTYIKGMRAVIHGDGLIHTSYKMAYTSTSRLSSTDPNCFPPGVEVLTEQGWFDISDVPADTRVAQVDFSSNVVTFDFPVDRVCHDFDGDLIHLNSGKMDIISTPNHRFCVMDDEGRLREVTAETYPNWYKQPVAGTFAGGTVVEDYDKLRLMCAIQADAYIAKNSKYIEWEFSKTRKIDRLRNLLTSCGITFSEKDYQLKDSKPTTRFYVAKRNAPAWMYEAKFFQWSIFNYTRECLNVICEELYHWDVCTDNYQWSTSVKENADVIQALLILSGRCTSVRVRPSTNDTLNYFLDSCDRTYISSGNTVKKDTVPYTGKVYCLTMPHDSLIVRYNGKVCFTRNSQNFPKRKHKSVRQIITVPAGFTIGSNDYGQIEARVFAMASKDKEFCKALWNDLDVHKDWALRIMDAYPEISDITCKKYGMSPSQTPEAKILKTFRSDVKNGWVFPQFFGSSASSCAANLKIPKEIATRLAKQFWEIFSDVKKWQNQTIKFYEKHGYVETLTGFRRYGPMSFNERINTPIQGTAAEIVLTAMLTLAREAENDPDFWFLQPNLNIHDDITMYYPEQHIGRTLEKIAGIMCNTKNPDFPFINVPLVAEMEAGRNWAKQRALGEFHSHKGWIWNKGTVIDCTELLDPLVDTLEANPTSCIVLSERDKDIAQALAHAFPSSRWTMTEDPDSLDVTPFKKKPLIVVNPRIEGDTYRFRDADLASLRNAASSLFTVL